jgi:hypothetical protein
MPFTKSEMVYNDYMWSQEQKQKKTEESDLEFNRLAGNQMIRLIQDLARDWEWNLENINAFRKLEVTIRTLVPKFIYSYSGVKNWIEDKCPDLFAVFREKPDTKKD